MCITYVLMACGSHSKGTLGNSDHIFGFWVKYSLEGTRLFGLAFSGSKKRMLSSDFSEESFWVVLQHAADHNRSWLERVRDCLFGAGNVASWLRSCLACSRPSIWFPAQEKAKGACLGNYVLCIPLAKWIHLLGQKWKLFCFIGKLCTSL